MWCCLIFFPERRSRVTTAKSFFLQQQHGYVNLVYKRGKWLYCPLVWNNSFMLLMKMGCTCCIFNSMYCFIMVCCLLTNIAGSYFPLSLNSQNSEVFILTIEIVILATVLPGIISLLTSVLSSGNNSTKKGRLSSEGYFNNNCEIIIKKLTCYESYLLPIFVERIFMN